MHIRDGILGVIKVGESPTGEIMVSYHPLTHRPFPPPHLSKATPNTSTAILEEGYVV